MNRRIVRSLVASFVLAIALAAPGLAHAAAPAFVQTIDAQSVVNDGNTLTLTVSAAGVAAGDTVLVVGSKGVDDAAIASVTDSKGNVYTVDKQLHGPGGTGMSTTVVSGYMANGLAPGDTITIQYEGTASYSNKIGAAYEFSGIAGNDIPRAREAF